MVPAPALKYRSLWKPSHHWVTSARRAGIKHTHKNKKMHVKTSWSDVLYFLLLCFTSCRLELHLVGGFNDDSKTSHKLSLNILGKVFSYLMSHCNIILALFGLCNTCTFLTLQQHFINRKRIFIWKHAVSQVTLVLLLISDQLFNHILSSPHPVRTSVFCFCRNEWHCCWWNS